MDGNQSNLHVVGDAHIGGPPSQLPSIGGKHEDIESALPGTIEQRQGLDTVVSVFHSIV